MSIHDEIDAPMIGQTVPGPGEDDWDDEDDFESPERFGEPGNLYNPDVHLKWVADGASDLHEMAEILRSYADHCDGLHSRGWKLSQPVDNSHGCVEWGGEGSPPVDDSTYVNHVRVDGKAWEDRHQE